MNSETTNPAKTPGLTRELSLELARVTERAAVAAARLRGRGDEKAADQARSTRCARNSTVLRSAAPS
jgi:fructose-1,6-bisphosphatase/sedoheptulose 1,7-bisphosphatase-like protein